MDEQTKGFIYRTLVLAVVGLLGIFAVAFVKVIWTDGSNTLVANVTQSMAWVLAISIVGIVSALIGRDLFSVLGSRPGNTSTTNISTPLAPQVTTAQTTIVQQKASEEPTA